MGSVHPFGVSLGVVTWPGILCCGMSSLMTGCCSAFSSAPWLCPQPSWMSPWKVAATVDSLTQESRTKDILRQHEGQLIALACSDTHKAADRICTRVLQRVFEEAEGAAVTKDAEGRNVWGVAFEQ